VRCKVSLSVSNKKKKPSLSQVSSFRGHHGGELIPGKGLVRHGKCHVSANGAEHVLMNFEVLMNTGGFTWEPASNGQQPHNAGKLDVP
jgi:hypothetical protein